jgi:hypothetical protein
VTDDEKTDVLGGAVGGVSSSDVPRIVENLLTEREHELEIWIRPERVGSKYTVEWTAVTYDWEELDWGLRHRSSTESSVQGLIGVCRNGLRQLLKWLTAIYTKRMPTFDVDRTRINAFLINETYLFKHYFEQDEVFSQLRQYYNESDYRFEIPADDLPAVQELLDEHFFELTVVDDLEQFCVVKRKYTDHPNVLFKASVMKREHQDYNVFLMKDQLSVEQAVNNGATRLKDTDLNIDYL